MFWNKRSGQNVFEYALVVFLVGVACAGIIAYFNHAFQGRYKEGADVFGDGEQFEPGVTQNYEPGEVGP